MTPTDEECTKFFDEKIRNGVDHIAWRNIADDIPVTPDKLRYIRDEISLFLGDELPGKWISAEAPPEPRENSDYSLKVIVYPYRQAGSRITAIYDHALESWTCSDEVKVTHWRELPPMPDGDK